VDASVLKAGLISICQQWQVKFTTYLNTHAIEELKTLHAQFVSSAQKLSRPPTSLDQLGDMLKLLKSLQVRLLSSTHLSVSRLDQRAN
jgi:dynein heavy chain